MTSDVRTGETGGRPTGQRRSETPSGQVRIVGAERAVDAAAGTGGPGGRRNGPAVEDSWGPEGFDAGSLDVEDREDGVPRPFEPELPHWTEAPTGEVPAVLARADDEPRAGVPEPSWREAPEDWELDEALGSSILDEATGAGGVSETDPSERQPWSFELGSARADAGLADLAGLDELDDLDTTDLFAPWPGATPRAAGAAEAEWGARPAVETGAGSWEPAAGHLAGDVRRGGAEGIGAEVYGTEGGWAEGPEPTTNGDGDHGHTWADAEPAREDPGSWGPDDVGGEKTSVLPQVTTSAHAHAHEAHDEEAAALDADLQTHGFRRRWQMRRPETVRGTTARHRARTPVSAPAPPAQPRRRAEDRVSERAGRNVPVAIASGLAIGAIALVAFHFGTIPSMVVVSVVLVLAAAEAYAAFRRAGYHPVTVLGLPAVAGVLVGAYDRTFQALPVVLVVLVVFTFLWHLLRVDARAEPVRSTAATVLVFCWIGVFGSFAALLLAPSLFPDRNGIAYLLGALIAAVAYDVGALAAGAAVGRHPLNAASPTKTWEGVAGGAVAAVALSLAVVRLIHPWTLEEAAILGVVVAVVSPIGDLCESLVKRHLGIKDMGRILPGHGGLLDRVDGLLFVLPAAYYLVRAFGHG